MSNIVSINRNFKKASNFQDFLEQSFPITCPIPKNREPEIGFIMPQMEIAHGLHEYLGGLPNIRITNEPEPDRGFIVTLPEDTVDENGYARRQIQALELEKRRRFNFCSDTKRLIRFDVSFKDAHKSTVRREWEAKANCLTSGNTIATRKVGVDKPEIFKIDPESYRVMGTCLVARSSSYFAHMISDESACIIYEANDDACALSTPHADILLGYRREKEFEAVKIYTKSEVDEERANEILNQGLSEIVSASSMSPYRTYLTPSNESKAAHTVRMVKEFYESQPHYGSHDGIDMALAQNVCAQDFSWKMENLFRLACTIPSPMALRNGHPNTDYKGYFPSSRSKSHDSSHLRIAN